MRVADLKKLLEKYDDDMLVVMPDNREGAGFNPVIEPVQIQLATVGYASGVWLGQWPGKYTKIKANGIPAISLGSPYSLY